MADEVLNKNYNQSELDDSSFLQDLIKLLVKIAIICLCFVMIFSFLFGAFRYEGLDMMPSVDDGDLIITYRLDKNFSRNDLTVFWYNGNICVGRVIAEGGDKVDITDQGVKVNDAILSELNIIEKTTQVKDAVKFPLVVPEGQLFVLGDNRDYAIDSRTIGCVEINKTEGKVIGLFRHRGI